MICQNSFESFHPDDNKVQYGHDTSRTHIYLYAFFVMVDFHITSEVHIAQQLSKMNFYPKTYALPEGKTVFLPFFKSIL